jgi:rfaE bifunctional protein nucleotidyltransferase chain/domain
LKIFSPLALAQALGPWEDRSRVVFTNGCFDVLHRGHTSYLAGARALGDQLVVALNTDESIRRLKGPKRPWNGLEDRLEVVAALESVSFVTWFEEETPWNLIVFLKPHVLVKGGDWDVTKIVGAQEVLSWGGQVRTLAFVEGRSSSRIIQKMEA